MTITYTQAQVNKKYNWKYVKVLRTYDYTKQTNIYEIVKTSKVIRENMTLWQDVGTWLEYTR